MPELNAFQQRYFSHCWSYNGFKKYLCELGHGIIRMLYVIFSEIKNDNILKMQDNKF